MSKPIVMYSQSYCPYCAAASALLTKKGVEFTVIDLGNQPEKREEMLTRSNGARTVPQIFIGEQHIGGFDDMNALDKKGELDSLLN
ncbi:MAG: glutaredoxin 3 [Pseudomonadota bacterium]